MFDDLVAGGRSCGSLGRSGILFGDLAKLSHPLAIVIAMTTSDFPVRSSSSSASPVAKSGTFRSSSVVSFRSRSPIDIAEKFSVELYDESIRRIDCNDCVLQYSSSCDDCVVNFLLTLTDDAESAAPGGQAVVAMTAPEADTLELLQATGFAPRSHFAVRPVPLDARRLVHT